MLCLSISNGSILRAVFWELKVFRVFPQYRLGLSLPGLGWTAAPFHVGDVPSLYFYLQDSLFGVLSSLSSICHLFAERLQEQRVSGEAAGLPRSPGPLHTGDGSWQRGRRWRTLP